MDVRDPSMADVAFGFDPAMQFPHHFSMQDSIDNVAGFTQMLSSPSAIVDADDGLVETISEEDRATLLPIIRIAFPSLKHTMQYPRSAGHNSAHANVTRGLDAVWQDGGHRYQSQSMIKGGVYDGLIHESVAAARRPNVSQHREDGLLNQSMSLPGKCDGWHHQFMQIEGRQAMPTHQSMASGVKQNVLHHMNIPSRVNGLSHSIMHKSDGWHGQFIPHNLGQDAMYYQLRQGLATQNALHNGSINLDARQDNLHCQFTNIERKHDKMYHSLAIQNGMLQSSMASEGNGKLMDKQGACYSQSMKVEGRHHLLRPIVASNESRLQGSPFSVIDDMGSELGLQSMLEGRVDQLTHQSMPAFEGRINPLQHQAMPVIEGHINHVLNDPVPAVGDSVVEDRLDHTSSILTRMDHSHKHAMPVVQSQQSVVYNQPIITEDERQHHPSALLGSTRGGSLHHQCVAMDDLQNGLHNALMAIERRQDGLVHESLAVEGNYKQAVDDTGVHSTVAPAESHFPVDAYAVHNLRCAPVEEVRRPELVASTVTDGKISIRGINLRSNFSSPVSSSYGSRIAWEQMQATPQVSKPVEMLSGEELCASIQSGSDQIEEIRSSKCYESADEQSLASPLSSNLEGSEFDLACDSSMGHQTPDFYATDSRSVNSAAFFSIDHLRFPEVTRKRRSVVKKAVGWIRKRRSTHLLNARMSHKRKCGLPCCTNGELDSKRRKTLVHSSKKVATHTCLSTTQKLQSFSSLKRTTGQSKGMRKSCMSTVLPTESSAIIRSSFGNESSHVTEEWVSLPLKEALIGVLSDSGSRGMTVSEALNRLLRQGHSAIFYAHNESQAEQVRMALTRCPEFEELSSGRFKTRSLMKATDNIFTVEAESTAEDDGYEKCTTETPCQEHVMHGGYSQSAANLVGSSSSQLTYPKLEQEVQQCHKTDGKHLRCSNQARPGFLYCNSHHQSPLSKVKHSPGNNSYTNMQNGNSIGTYKADSSQTFAETCTGQSLEVKAEPEFVRCRKTDGKFWRCLQAAKPGSIYCEHHLQQRILGRVKGRKRRKSSTMKVARQDTMLLDKLVKAKGVQDVNQNSDRPKVKQNNLQGLARRVVERSQMTLRERKNRKTVMQKGAVVSTECSSGTPQVGVGSEKHDDMLNEKVMMQKAKANHHKRADISRITRLVAELTNPTVGNRKGSMMAVSKADGRGKSEQCHKNDGKHWRCSQLCKPGFAYCEHHRSS